MSTFHSLTALGLFRWRWFLFLLLATKETQQLLHRVLLRWSGLIGLSIGFLTEKTSQNSCSTAQGIVRTGQYALQPHLGELLQVWRKSRTLKCASDYGGNHNFALAVGQCRLHIAADTRTTDLLAECLGEDGSDIEI